MTKCDGSSVGRASEAFLTKRSPVRIPLPTKIFRIFFSCLEMIINIYSVFVKNTFHQNALSCL